MTTTTDVAKQADLERLLFRLEDGWNKIVEAQNAGQDVARWDDVWLRLLAEYEALYDEIAGGR